MQNFSAAFEPSELPSVTVEAWSSVQKQENAVITHVVAVLEGDVVPEVLALPKSLYDTALATLQGARDVYSFHGKQAQVLPPCVVDLGGGQTCSVMLLGLGKVDELVGPQWGRNAWHDAGHALAAAVKAYNIKRVTVQIPSVVASLQEVQGVYAATRDVPVLGVTMTTALTSFVAAALSGLYEGTIRYRSKPASAVKLASISISVQGMGQATPAMTEAVKRGVALARATLMAQFLVEAPANVCTPTHLAAAAQHLAASDPQHCSLQVHDAAAVRDMGMGLFLGVAQGTPEPLKLIHLTYTPAGPVTRVVALVGKGLTFDSGGYNLKVQGGIQTMKCDMGGAGAILGAARAISLLKPQGVQVHFITAACENMVSGTATRPGDIHVSAAGKTVEVNDTDAEGRLTLADALWYAQEKAGAKTVVDIATLTGAAGVALGNTTGALFATSDGLAHAIDAASRRAGEKLWRMPLDSGLSKKLESPIADLKNYAGRPGGAITAALFLKEFIRQGTAWAHLDVAGPAWDDEACLPTGFGAATLTEWVMELAKAS